MNYVQRKKRYKVNLPEQLMRCEVNYQRMLSLMPQLIELPAASCYTFGVGDPSTVETMVEMRVVEQTKYTTVVHIMQYYPLQKDDLSIKTSAANHQPLSLYQSNVRLYHDATMAEVVKCQCYHQFQSRYDYPNSNMHQINEKAQLNQFLGELLSHCMRHARTLNSGIESLFSARPSVPPSND